MTGISNRRAAKHASIIDGMSITLPLNRTFFRIMEEESMFAHAGDASVVVENLRLGLVILHSYADEFRPVATARLAGARLE